jgi:hypothetical protein
MERALSPAWRRLRASVCCGSVSLGLRPNFVPWALALAEETLAEPPGASPVEALDQADAIHHGAGGTVPHFRWTVGTGMVDLGTLGGESSTAIAVNADGSVVVGQAISLSATAQLTPSGGPVLAWLTSAP